MPGERQAVSLDGIGDEQGGAVVGDAVERIDQRFRAMTAKVRHHCGKPLVVEAVEQRPHMGLGADVGSQPRPPRGTALIGECGIFRVGAGIDPLLERLPARPLEGGALQFTVLERQHPPAAGLEDVVEPAEHAVGGGGIERLPIIVDDPPAIPEIVLIALDQALVDIPFVELGVAHQRDHPPGILLPDPAVRDEIVLHQRREGSDRDTQPDGTRREIDGDRVLGPAGIALHAAQSAEPLQPVERLIAEEIMDRVQHRAGMRLHRHLVLRPQRVEIERRHDCRDRRAAGLMPADLQAVALGAKMIRVVDRPRTRASAAASRSVRALRSSRRGPVLPMSPWHCPSLSTRVFTRLAAACLAPLGKAQTVIPRTGGSAARSFPGGNGRWRPHGARAAGRRHGSPGSRS